MPLLFIICQLINNHVLVAGMKDGQQVRFTGEGDQLPGIEPGDIVVILDEKPHPVFKRQKENLVMNMEIDLVDALCGFQKTVETMDSRSLVITSHPGSLIYNIILSIIILSIIILSIINRNVAGSV